MMKRYNFDNVIERRCTNSLKYDFAVERGYPASVLPLWVADMDFRTAEPILEALHKAVNHGIFGYSEVKSEYYRAVSSWFGRHFAWLPAEDWLVKTPGLVFALAMAVRSLTDPNDSVLVQTPVYYPFFSVIRDNGRRLVENELICRDGHYEIDFADFEAKIVENNVKLFILCSPHNPVGRVWTEEELKKIGKICKRHGVYVVSDEIHCDFTFNGHVHTVFAKACPDLADRTIICTAPSKTFNIAGLQISNIWIPNEEIKKKFQCEIDCTGYSQHNTLGLVAARAAYENGEEWFLQCREYISGNMTFLKGFIEQEIPQIKLIRAEGTYFAWLDFSDLGLERKEIKELVVNKAGLWLDAGHIFGGKSDQFQRLVLACPRTTVEEALCRLKKAVSTTCFQS